MLQALSKFSDSHTMAKGIEEMRKIMQVEITDNERMICFLNSVSEHNEHWKPQQKKEYIKLLGTASEIFEDALVPFMPKVIQSLQKRIKEGGSVLHPAIAETFGELTKNILAKVQSQDEQSELFLNTFLKFPMYLLEKSPNKTV